MKYSLSINLRIQRLDDDLATEHTVVDATPKRRNSLEDVRGQGNDSFSSLQAHFDSKPHTFSALACTSTITENAFQYYIVLPVNRR